MLPATLQFLIVMIARSINERMQKRLDYKTEEVLVLKEILRSVTGKGRIDFTENHRKRLAAKGKELTPKEREACCELARPRTILDWFAGSTPLNTTARNCVEDLGVLANRKRRAGWS